MLFALKFQIKYEFPFNVNQANFVELIVIGFSQLNPRDNEIYLLGDYSINLLQNGNYILNRKGVAACQKPVHTLIKKYQEFCQIFSLKQFVNMQHLFSN